MSKRDTYESRTEALLLPILEANNFELVDVEYVKERGPEFLTNSISTFICNPASTVA